MINLALNYFCRGLPPNYLRRSSVSPLSSGWISVVPLRHKHQESYDLERIETLLTKP
jgi:hypothetical protein